VYYKWILLLKARSDRIHLRLRLLQSDAGFKAGNNFEKMITALRASSAGNAIGTHS
jgi:hypothetical protein